MPNVIRLPYMAEKEDIITKEITLSMGPQHPSTHGVLHLLLDMKGETILKADPDIGYLHRALKRLLKTFFTTNSFHIRTDLIIWLR